MNETWALVPVKTPADAKSRLAPLLSPEERAGFALHMLRDVLGALRSAGVNGIALLTPGAGYAVIAEEFRCRMFADDPARDWSANLESAAAELATGGARTVVIVPADLPALTSGDVATLLAAHRVGVTVVPAAVDGGTNALAMTPPGAVPCLFGPDSARRHLEAAHRQGLAAALLHVPGFARDIDTVDDVRWLCGAGGSGPTRQYLDRSGICARLLRRDEAEVG